MFQSSCHVVPTLNPQAHGGGVGGGFSCTYRERLVELLKVSHGRVWDLHRNSQAPGVSISGASTPTIDHPQTRVGGAPVPHIGSCPVGWGPLYPSRSPLGSSFPVASLL